jgi:hypothetical protein
MKFWLNIKTKAGTRRDQLISTVDDQTILAQGHELLDIIEEAKRSLDLELSNFEKAMYGIDIDSRDWAADLDKASKLLPFLVFELQVRNAIDYSDELVQRYQAITGREGMLDLPATKPKYTLLDDTIDKLPF